MNANETIRHALHAADIHEPIAGTRDLSGGCIHHVVEVTLADGRRVVAKINRASEQTLFDEEAHSLNALAATNTVLVPQPLIVTSHAKEAVLLMTAIEAPRQRPGASAWRRFGEELARLHQTPVGERYGLEIDNHIGSTYQPNSWRDDWVEFNAVNRQGFQLHTAIENDLLEAHEADRIQKVIDRLDRLIPRRPKPALLHGDLWSGNALPAADQRIAVIDPACSIGDGWADIAMMRLFGGFPPACLEAYAALNADHDQREERIAVYQLYHVLNHVNIFGRGYVAQALDLARRLGA